MKDKQQTKGVDANPGQVGLASRIDHKSQSELETKLREEKVKQAGIGFPSAGRQRHLLIVRLNLAPSAVDSPEAVRAGLRRLCTLFADIDSGKRTIDVLNDQTGVVEPTNLQQKFL